MKFRSLVLRRLFFVAGPALVLAGVNCAASSFGYASGTMSATLEYRQSGQLTGCTYNNVPSGSCSYINGTGFLPYNSSNGMQWTLVQNDLSAALSSSVDAQGLHTDASLTVTNEPLEPLSQHYWGSNPGTGTAAATWSDTLTVGGATPGYLVIAYSLDGSLNASGSSRADIFTSYAAYDTTSGYSNHNQNLYSTSSSIGPAMNGTQAFLDYIPVSIGDQISLTIQLQSRILYGCQAFSPVLCSGSVDANASHTLKFTQVGFQDNNGNWISGDSIISADGFNYGAFDPTNASTSAAPEPGSLIYCAGLLMAGAGWKFARLARR